MLGYKIATHVTQYGNDIVDSYHMEGIKVLVILDIPDDVKRTTPEMRYSKIPSGLTNNEFNEWASEARKYKKYADSNKLFRDFKDFANGCAFDINRFDDSHSFVCYGPYIHVRKCRAAKAKIVRIIDLFNGDSYNHAVSDFDNNTIYQTGETVIPDAYTDCYLNICAHGIHYFESPELALLWCAVDLLPRPASAFLNHAEGLLEKLRKGGDI